jgi:hypothetical protein
MSKIIEPKEPHIEIDNLQLKPWSNLQFRNLIPTLEEVYNLFEQSGITFEKVTQKDNKTILLIIKIVYPFLSKIISETIGLSIEEVEVWEFDRSAILGLHILILNAQRMKEFLKMSVTMMSPLIN